MYTAGPQRNQTKASRAIGSTLLLGVQSHNKQWHVVLKTKYNMAEGQYGGLWHY